MMKIIKGNPYRISTILIIIESTLPPTYPATIPQDTPITRATPVATNPTSNDILAPYNIRLNRSLPRISVPNKCSPDGGLAPKFKS